MTADGKHIVGAVPWAEGFYAATGCIVGGLSISRHGRDAGPAHPHRPLPPPPPSQTTAPPKAGSSWEERDLLSRKDLLTASAGLLASPLCVSALGAGVIRLGTFSTRADLAQEVWRL